VLAEGTHYTVTIKNSNNQVVTSVTAEGDYTLTITGTGTKGNGYYGSQIVSFTIVQFSIDNSFNQDEAGYYYINMPGVGTNTINLDLRDILTELGWRGHRGRMFCTSEIGKAMKHMGFDSRRSHGTTKYLVVKIDPNTRKQENIDDAKEFIPDSF
jgi:hypothetical protein